MKTRAWKMAKLLLCFILLPSSFGLRAWGQSYSIDWYKIAGGGGTSAGATYQVTGTIGQPDASGAMTGGSYSLTGGFWSLISVVQMPGVPNLIIVPNGPNSVKILWPDTGSYTLQQNSNLAATAGWTTSGYTLSHSINDNVTRDGRRITCEWRNTPWRDGSGQIRGILSIVSDITEKKQAAEKFAREQARFKLIFDTVPVGIAFHTVHPDGRFTRTINDAHLRLCGLTREQHDQPGIYAQITHPEDHALQQRFIAQVNAGVRKHYSMEKRYLHPDGKVVWVDFSYQREIYPDGTIEELTTVVDITERKTVEQQLMQLAVIVESSEDAIVSKTLDGIITSWNRGAEIIFGHPASETLGQPMLMLFPDELKHEEADILARIACGESVEHFETERLRKDGTRLRVSATISPLDRKSTRLN